MATRPAEYYRRYRATKNGMQETKERQMFKQGVAGCIAIARETVGGKALTGYQFARLLENSLLEVETQESKSREAFISGLRPLVGP